ncbi:DUF4367 domain-containing protein [Bacillus spongiae]|uniref:DUF4367 domain-containing protein n=1 Tax=Bacillus spongiae TaxID=2683610 RepID=A0ABU8HIG2_9BACI
MKKILLLLITIPIFVIGCSSEANLVTYDNEELTRIFKNEFVQPKHSEELNEESSLPKLPTKLPFKPDQVDFSQPPPHYEEGSLFLIFDFLSKGESYAHLQLQVVNMETEYDTDFEAIKIGDIEGFYYSESPDLMLLNWVEEEIHYDLKYVASSSDKYISKEEFITIAESFK